MLYASRETPAQFVTFSKFRQNSILGELVESHWVVGKLDCQTQAIFCMVQAITKVPQD